MSISPSPVPVNKNTTATLNNCDYTTSNPYIQAELASGAATKSFTILDWSFSPGGTVDSGMHSFSCTGHFSTVSSSLNDKTISVTVECDITYQGSVIESSTNPFSVNLTVFSVSISGANIVAVGKSITLTAAPTPSGLTGSYAWSITQGGNKATIQGNGSSATVTGVSPSSTMNDVTVQVQFTPTDASEPATATYSLTVWSISQSADLWWFNGASPGGYATQINLTANGLSSGTFSWSITQGSDKVTLQNANSNPVAVSSIGESLQVGDVSIQLTYNNTVLGTYLLTVYAPDEYVIDTISSDNYYGPTGFERDYTMHVISNLYGIVYAVTNEYFYNRGDDYSQNTWGSPSPKSVTPNPSFTDRYYYYNPNAQPPTVNPDDNNWHNLIFHIDQDYYVGSATSGVGKKITPNHGVQYYQGDGQQFENFQ